MYIKKENFEIPLKFLESILHTIFSPRHEILTFHWKRFPRGHVAVYFSHEIEHNSLAASVSIHEPDKNRGRPKGIIRVMSVGVVVGNVLIITLPIDAHVSHAFCAREFIKRHLIGSRATLVSPRIFPPLRPFPRAPRTKVEYSATGFGRCTMSRAMSTLLFSFPPPLYSFHALVRGIFSSSAVARIDLLSLLGDLRIFVPSFNPFFPPPATWKVEPRRVCRRLNRRRVSALISSRFAVERCRCVTDARHVNYTVNVKGKGEGVEGRMVEFTLYGGCANIC